MRARRIDEIRRGGSPLDSLGVGNAAVHPAWNLLVGAGNGEYDDPNGWPKLLEYAAKQWETFGRSLSDFVAKKMECDPILIRINHSLLMSSSFKNAANQIIQTIECPANRIAGHVADESIFEGLVNVNAGIATLTVVMGKTRVDYYLIRGPKQI